MTKRRGTPDPTTAVAHPRHAAVPEWVWKHPDVIAHPTSLLVYCALYSIGNYKDRTTPSDWAEVARLTGLSKATTMRLMKVLREANIVVKVGDSLLKLAQDTPDPGRIYETGGSHICDQPVSYMRSAPSFTEVSEMATSAGADTLFPQSPKPPRATDDPLTARAHELATLAFQQTPRPITKFPAVMARCKEALEAGHEPDAIRTAITSGDIVWTQAGLTTAIAMARGRDGNTRPRNRGEGDWESLPSSRQMGHR